MMIKRLAASSRWFAFWLAISLSVIFFALLSWQMLRGADPKLAAASSASASRQLIIEEQKADSGAKTGTWSTGSTNNPVVSSQS